MTEVAFELPTEPIDQLRILIRDIHVGGYTDVDAMRNFLSLYEDAHFIENGRDDTFFESLDSPEVDLEFDEGVFDYVVEMYEKEGGLWADLRYPDIKRLPPEDWAKELQTLHDIFQTPLVQSPQSYALYVRQNADELRQVDQGGGLYQSLLSNPTFLSGIARVYDEDTDDLEGNFLDYIPDDEDEFLYDVLEAVGYRYAATHQTDWAYKHLDHALESDGSNLKAIEKLENERSGATKYLSEVFGIRHFSRYPTELLVVQHDNQGVVDKPYGVMICAVYDHNGAFTYFGRTGRDMPSKLYEQLDGKYELLAAEAESVPEFEQRLQYFDDLNGSQRKIDFALIEAHGRPDGIKFGTAHNIGSLALKERLREVGKIFSPKACITLTSCSTGKKSGIAQDLSRQFKATVIAPPEVTATHDVLLINDTDGVRLAPTYTKYPEGHRVSAVVYKQGLAFGEQRAAAYLQTELDSEN